MDERIKNRLPTKTDNYSFFPQFCTKQLKHVATASFWSINLQNYILVKNEFMQKKNNYYKIISLDIIAPS